MQHAIYHPHKIHALAILTKPPRAAVLADPVPACKAFPPYQNRRWHADKLCSATAHFWSCTPLGPTPAWQHAYRHWPQLAPCTAKYRRADVYTTGTPTCVTRVLPPPAGKDCNERITEQSVLPRCMGASLSPDEKHAAEAIPQLPSTLRRELGSLQVMSAWKMCAALPQALFNIKSERRRLWSTPKENSTAMHSLYLPPTSFFFSNPFLPVCANPHTELVQ